MKKRDTEQTDLKRRIANLTPEQKKLMERGMVNAGVGKFMGLQAKGESRTNGYYLNLKKREPQSETVSSGEAWRGVEVISDMS